MCNWQLQCYPFKRVPQQLPIAHAASSNLHAMHASSMRVVSTIVNVIRRLYTSQTPLLRVHCTTGSSKTNSATLSNLQNGQQNAGSTTLQPFETGSKTLSNLQNGQQNPVRPSKRAATQPCQTSNIFSAGPVGLVTTAQVFGALGTATTRADDETTLLTLVPLVALGLLPYTW